MPDRTPPDCRLKALDLLARRPHFRDELGRKLLERGFDPAEVETTLDRLAELGYLDDGALAGSEAGRLRERHGLARAGVAAKLKQKGAAPAAVRAAVAGIAAEDELAAARAVAERWRRTHAPDAAALGRHLARKGYAPHVIFRLLNELVPGAAEGADEP